MIQLTSQKLLIIVLWLIIKLQILSLPSNSDLRIFDDRHKFLRFFMIKRARVWNQNMVLRRHNQIWLIAWWYFKFENIFNWAIILNVFGYVLVCFFCPIVVCTYLLGILSLEKFILFLFWVKFSCHFSKYFKMKKIEIRINYF